MCDNPATCTKSRPCESCFEDAYERHIEDLLGLNDWAPEHEPPDYDPEAGMSESDYIPRGIPQVPTPLREPDCDWKECPGEDIPF